MPQDRYLPSASPIATSFAVSAMNVSTDTEDDSVEEMATTPTARAHSVQAHAQTLSLPRSVSSQAVGKRPNLSHRISIASSLIPPSPSSASPYSRGRSAFASSLPSPGWAGPSRDYFQRESRADRDPTATAKVAPQNDFLANWESLQDLVMPAPEGARYHSRSPSARRRDQSPAVGSMPSQPLYGSLDTSTPGRDGTFGRAASRRIPRVPSVTETDEEGDEGEEDLTASYYSAILSSSPPTLDGFGATPSFGVVSEQMGPMPSPDRGSPAAATLPRIMATSGPGPRTDPPSGAPPATPATPSAAKKPGKLTVIFLFAADSRTALQVEPAGVHRAHTQVWSRVSHR